MTITTTLLTLNEPNKNGHVYTTETIQAALDKFENKDRLFVTPTFSGTSDISLHEIIAKVNNARIEGNRLLGEIEFLPGLPAYDSTYEQLLKDEKISIRPKGLGGLRKQENSEFHEVTNYELIGFVLTDDPA